MASHALAKAIAMQTIENHDTRHYEEVVSRMLVLEELPDSAHKSELNMLA